MKNTKAQRARATMLEIIKAAKHAASLPELEYQELRDELVAKLGMRMSDFDNQVKRYRKENQTSAKASFDEITTHAKHAAALPRLEYDMYREEIVRKLGIKFPAFDREVERQRKQIRVMDGRRITLTDAGNGQRFVNRNSDVIRSCRQLTKSGWFFWNNQRWVPDAIGDAMELARQTVVDIATHAAVDYKAQIINGEQYVEELAWSMTSLSDKSLKAMLNQASQGTAICVTADKFDTHPELLNCQNGTLHLDTGEFYPARREDLLTQIANVNYDPTATCTKWQKFISEALDGKMPTIEYVQRVTGYLLTGTQSEQCFFLIQGQPGTGRSTFWRVIRFTMGDYFEMVSSGLFVKPPRNKRSSGEEASPALVKLVGKRVAAEVELGEDDAFASTLLKRITGGESLTARPLYKEPFTFQPQCKPVFLTNHQPGTDDFSGGLEDRLRIIKFNVKFRGTAGEN
jgi:putative DNA primase/helicase